jgi:hypothetical protein
LLEDVETYEAVRRLAARLRADAARALKLSVASAEHLLRKADVYLSVLRRQLGALGGTLTS